MPVFMQRLIWFETEQASCLKILTISSIHLLMLMTSLNSVYNVYVKFPLVFTFIFYALTVHYCSFSKIGDYVRSLPCSTFTDTFSKSMTLNDIIFHMAFIRETSGSQEIFDQSVITYHNISRKIMKQLVISFIGELCILNSLKKMYRLF